MTVDQMRVILDRDRRYMKKREYIPLHGSSFWIHKRFSTGCKIVIDKEGNYYFVEVFTMYQPIKDRKNVNSAMAIYEKSKRMLTMLRNAEIMSWKNQDFSNPNSE